MQDEGGLQLVADPPEQAEGHQQHGTRTTWEIEEEEMRNHTNNVPSFDHGCPVDIFKIIHEVQAMPLCAV